MPDLLRAFELCAKTVRTLLTTPQLTRPFRQPFTPECMRGETWLADKEAEEEVYEPVDLGDYPPLPRSYDKCSKCGGDYVMRHYCKPPWWSAEAVKARARVESPLSATFTDELDDVSLSRQRFLDEQHGPDRICIYCFKKRSECTHSYQEMFAPKTPDATSATRSSGEDPPRGAEEAPRGADSQIVELTADAEKRVAEWVRAVISYGRSDADLVRGFQRLIAVSDKAEP